MLRGGRVIDGTGKGRFRADVAIQGERIAGVGELPGAPARRTIDCEGLAIAPSFVDFHGHGEEGR